MPRYCNVCRPLNNKFTIAKSNHLLSAELQSSKVEFFVSRKARTFWELKVWVKALRSHIKMNNVLNITENNLFLDSFNLSQNISGEDTVSHIITSALNVPSMLVAILGNSLVLAAILSTPSLRSPAILLLCNLAVSDLLVGLAIQPVFIASAFHSTRLPASIWFILSYSACGISLCTMTAIAVDRFLALHYHLRYSTMVTSFRIKTFLTVQWLKSFIFSGIYFWSLRIFFLYITIFVCLCLIISVFCYLRIFKIVRHQQKKIQCQHQAVNLPQGSTISNLLQLKKSAINSFLFFIVMVLFYIPVATYLSLYVTKNHSLSGWRVATTLVYINSSVNPFLYCWRMGDLRAAVVKTAKKLFCKR